MDSIGKLLRCLFYPSRCVVCRKVISPGECLCESCMIEFRREKMLRCHRCGLVHIHCSCPVEDPNCRLSGIYHLLEYENGSIAQKLIFRIKDRPSEDVSLFLAREIYDVIGKRDDFPDAVLTYVPRRKKMIRDQGCDQAKELVENICALAGKEAVCTLIRKGEKAQKSLSGEERRENVRRSYYPDTDCRELITGKTVFLIDDIITTGSTVSYCGDILLDAGAARVIAVGIARRTKRM